MVAPEAELICWQSRRGVARYARMSHTPNHQRGSHQVHGDTDQLVRFEIGKPRLNRDQGATTIHHTGGDALSNFAKQ
jgi:hypothetical protein